jgi:hypothetical protein
MNVKIGTEAAQFLLLQLHKARNYVIFGIFYQTELKGILMITAHLSVCCIFCVFLMTSNTNCPLTIGMGELDSTLP